MASVQDKAAPEETALEGRHKITFWKGKAAGWIPTPQYGMEIMTP